LFRVNYCRYEEFFSDDFEQSVIDTGQARPAKKCHVGNEGAWSGEHSFAALEARQEFFLKT
jgi:hypothetical protein